MLYGSKCWTAKTRQETEVTGSRNVHVPVHEWNEVSWTDRIKNEQIRGRLGVAGFRDKMREHQLRCFDYVMGWG